jgi:hypothetical protein
MFSHKPSNSAACSEQVKTFKLVANKLDLVQARRHIAGCAIGRDVRVLAFEERRKRFSTELEVTVVGHPRHVREFHEDVGGSKVDHLLSGSNNFGGGDGDLVGDLVAWVVVEGLSVVGSAAWHKWQARNDPPLYNEDLSTSLRARTVVFWKWQQSGADGEPVGAVWVDTYGEGQSEPETSEEWPQWTRRSHAGAYAREHGHIFFPDE